MTRFRVTVTCSCGAFLEADSHSEAHVQSVYREWAESHARCGSAVSRRYPIRPVPPPPYEDVDIRGDYTWSN